MKETVLAGIIICGVGIFVLLLGIIPQCKEGDHYTVIGEFIAAVGFIILLSSSYISEQKESKEIFYPLTAVVIDVDNQSDVVTCVDGNGERWKITNDSNYIIGDLVSLLMNSKGTSSICDDYIVTAVYSNLSILED